MGSKRGIAAFVLASLVVPLGACTTVTVPAPATTGTGTVAAPAARTTTTTAPVPVRTSPPPAGAVYGRVLGTDGRLITDADVSLFQLTRDDEIRTGFALVFSLGFFCLAPGVCPTPVHAELSSDGFYAFPPKVMKQTPDLALTATRPARDDDLSPASTSLSLPNGRDPQHAPDLAIWEPKLRVTKRGNQAVVRWPRLTGATHGRDLAYSVWVRPIDDFGATSQRVAGPTTRTEATLDLRTYEDQPTEVVVLAGTKANVQGQEVEFGYRTAGHELPLSDPPPSRDRPCRVDGESGGLVPAKAPCPLTDGELDLHAEVLAPGECSVDARTCEADSHRRLCVDLGEARSVSLVVFRTPFGLRAEDIRVEASVDGRNFDTVGRGRDADVIAVPLRSPRTARFVCLRDEFEGHLISELSVW